MYPPYSGRRCDAFSKNGRRNGSAKFIYRPDRILKAFAPLVSAGSQHYLREGEGMTEIVSVSISDLLLDQDNARFTQSQASQQDAYLELSKILGSKLVILAEDILNHGLDPTTFVVIVPTGDQRTRYKVIEGNRRVLALKALETPSITEGGLPQIDQRKLKRLSYRFHEKPLATIQAVLFEKPEEATHWIKLRHTGLNSGAGLVVWSSNETDRFISLHSGKRKPAGQILDFVLQHGTLSPEASASSQKIVTNLERLFSSRIAREKLGIEIVNGIVVSFYPASDVAKGLSHVVEDFLTGRSNVRNVYTAADRANYVAQLPNSVMPTGERLEVPSSLTDLGAGRITPVVEMPRRRRPRQTAERTSVIPSSCALYIPTPRINRIYNELRTLNLEEHPNAGSVLIRVFLELSVGHRLDSETELSNYGRDNFPLAKKMKTLANYLFTKGLIPQELKKAVELTANNDRGMLQASAMTFNQYIHNPHANPSPSDIRAAWDTLQPFLEAIWS